MNGPDYIVIRDPEAPEISGTWYDLSKLTEWDRLVNDESTEVFSRFYVPTPFIEVRDDGAVAQVWMPVRGS